MFSTRPTVVLLNTLTSVPLVIEIDIDQANDDRVMVRAKSAAHGYPMAQNVIEACHAIGCELTDEEEATVNGNEAGLFAFVSLPRTRFAGNGFVARLIGAADKRREDAASAVVLAGTTAEA